MTSRRPTLLVLLAGCAALIAPAISGHGPILVWNVSASVPLGLYRTASADQIAIADLVAVRPPAPLAALLSERSYLAPGVPIIKQVLALPGAIVCRFGMTIITHDQILGDARTADSLGRPLPSWQGCRLLGDDEIFLMNPDAAESFDGRYFGPLPISSVTARLTPLWTDHGGDGRFVWRGDASASPPSPFPPAPQPGDVP